MLAGYKKDSRTMRDVKYNILTHFKSMSDFWHYDNQNTITLRRLKYPNYKLQNLRKRQLFKMEHNPKFRRWYIAKMWCIYD